MVGEVSPLLPVAAYSGHPRLQSRHPAQQWHPFPVTFMSQFHRGTTKS